MSIPFENMTRYQEPTRNQLGTNFRLGNGRNDAGSNRLHHILGLGMSRLLLKLSVVSQVKV